MLPIHPHNQGTYILKPWLHLTALRLAHSFYTGKKTVVFDLDETLIHCNESAGIASDVIIPIRFPNNEVVDVRAAG